jgi:predicted nucleic acid-binding protein
LRVVLDTSIVVSAQWNRLGLEHQIFNCAMQGQLTLLASEPVPVEYRDVLPHPEFCIVNARVFLSIVMPDSQIDTAR